MVKFIKDLFSVDEVRVSALVLCLFFAMGVATYSYFYKGDVSENWIWLIEILVIAVGGVNGLKTLSILKEKSSKENLVNKEDISKRL